MGDWVSGVDYPEWMGESSLTMLKHGYLLKGESPKDAIFRVAKAAASRLDMPELESKFFDMVWKNWLCLSTPVFGNMGTDRGLPISCYTMNVPDSIIGIGESNTELMRLTQKGGGVGITFSDVRASGSPIRDGGTSNGVIPFIKIMDSTIVGTNQGNLRRGAASINLDINHGDFKDFLQIRRPKGDVNRQCLNINHCAVIDDAFMKRLDDPKDKEARDKWVDIMKTRLETGQPYIMYRDNVNKANPEWYKKRGLEVNGTNICTEITLFHDEYHTFVCCLSSLNLERWHEWKDTDTVRMSIYFLDAVMEEFIAKAERLPYFSRAVEFAKNSRALGLGVLGWHYFLQSEMLPFNSFGAVNYTHIIFSHIKKEAEAASRELAEMFGEPKWLKGYGVRNSHLIAVAPTFSNAEISNTSASIEPEPSNYYNRKTAKSTFFKKSKYLKRLLEKKGKDTKEVWDSLIATDGSVQHLSFLSDEEKEVFLTFPEINQLELVRQAAIRQKYIDQAQSLNLSFPSNATAKWISTVHREAWALGLKTLYYLRSESVLKGDIASKAMSDACSSCEG